MPCGLLLSKLTANSKTEASNIVSITRESVQDVCNKLADTFPNGDSDPPFVPTHFIDDIGRCVIRNQSHRLLISEECFQFHDLDKIVEALSELDYAKELTEYPNVMLGCIPNRAPPVPKIQWGDWYLLPGSN